MTARRIFADKTESGVRVYAYQLGENYCVIAIDLESGDELAFASRRTQRSAMKQFYSMNPTVLRGKAIQFRNRAVWLGAVKSMQPREPEKRLGRSKESAGIHVAYMPSPKAAKLLPGCYRLVVRDMERENKIVYREDFRTVDEARARFEQTDPWVARQWFKAGNNPFPRYVKRRKKAL